MSIFSDVAAIRAGQGGITTKLGEIESRLDDLDTPTLRESLTNIEGYLKRLADALAPVVVGIGAEENPPTNRP